MITRISISGPTTGIESEIMAFAIALYGATGRDIAWEEVDEEWKAPASLSTDDSVAIELDDDLHDG